MTSWYAIQCRHAVKYTLVSLYNPLFNNLPFKAPILTDIDAKPERPGVVGKTAAYLVLNQY